VTDPEKVPLLTSRVKLAAYSQRTAEPNCVMTMANGDGHDSGTASLNEIVTGRSHTRGEGKSCTTGERRVTLPSAAMSTHAEVDADKSCCAETRSGSRDGRAPDGIARDKDASAALKDAESLPMICSMMGDETLHGSVDTSADADARGENDVAMAEGSGATLDGKPARVAEVGVDEVVVGNEPDVVEIWTGTVAVDSVTTSNVDEATADDNGKMGRQPSALTGRVKLKAPLA
jgi:hypothetical protein